MKFFIADTFQSALAKLDNNSQKAAKMCAYDLQVDPTGKGKQFHKVDRSKEKNFWSVRASRDIRLIVHKTADRFTLCYVDHHDDAYDWAERRVFETHPTTGALQIVEIVERVEEVISAQVSDLVEQGAVYVPPSPALGHLTSDDLLDHGVPPRWAERLLAADEDEVYRLTDHLPGEASEAILAFLMGETPARPVAAEEEERRRFRNIDHSDELAAALDFPWDKWSVFLHPSQRQVVDRQFTGPARVAGSAGTGKTVVALHRAVRASAVEGARVLLTTFSRALASALEYKIGILTGDARGLAPNIHVSSFIDAASELYEIEYGRQPHIVNRAGLVRHFVDIAPHEEQRFLLSEWEDVVDGWQIKSLDDYLNVSRSGRRSRLSKNARERLWPVFQAVRERIIRSGRLTEAMVFSDVQHLYEDRKLKPYTHIIVDEAQDLGVAELRFLSSIADRDNLERLFFAGDLGQRVFQNPFSWAALGIDVRGRSATLNVNYRTSHQVRSMADRLLPEALSDMDGNTDARKGTVSVFNGPDPTIATFANEISEQRAVASWVGELIENGIGPREIAIIVRDKALLGRARAVGTLLKIPTQTLTESVTLSHDRLCLGAMHLAKGLEFRAVAIIGCDDTWLPLESRLSDAATEYDLEAAYNTERHLFYVASTRAREWLHISGVEPVSDFLRDLVEE